MTSRTAKQKRQEEEHESRRRNSCNAKAAREREIRRRKGPTKQHGATRYCASTVLLGWRGEEGEGEGRGWPGVVRLPHTHTRTAEHSHTRSGMRPSTANAATGIGGEERGWERRGEEGGGCGRRMRKGVRRGDTAWQRHSQTRHATTTGDSGD